MTIKFSLMLRAACLIALCSWPSAAWADDEAAAALQRSFLALQSVHSYRLTVLMRRPTFDMKDAKSVTEMTNVPRAEDKVTTVGANAYEQVVVNGVAYTRKNLDTWTVKAVGTEIIPWVHDWIKPYGPADSYFLIRQDVLDSTPVSVYLSLRTKGDVQTQTEIWIATTDHLPHRIVRHMTYSGKYQMDIIETLSDFNAPFKIMAPDVSVPDASRKQVRPYDDYEH